MLAEMPNNSDPLPIALKMQHGIRFMNYLAASYKDIYIDIPIK